MTLCNNPTMHKPECECSRTTQAERKILAECRNIGICPDCGSCITGKHFSSCNQTPQHMPELVEQYILESLRIEDGQLFKTSCRATNAAINRLLERKIIRKDTDSRLWILLDDIQNKADLQKRYQTCVNACAGIANPEALPDLIATIKRMIYNDDLVGGNWYQIPALKIALAKLEGN